MEISSKSIEDVVVMSPSGRIDHSTVAGFQESLLGLVEDCARNEHSLVLDLSGVVYMSSVGLRALMIAAKECKKANVSVSIAAMQPDMKEIFEISRFQLIFKTYGEVGEAIATVSDAAASAFAADTDSTAG